MSLVRNFMTPVLVVGLALTATAQEKAKGKKGGATPTINAQILRAFEKANLTDEQKTKLKELTDKLQTEVDKLKEDAGITAEIVKARTDATKKAKENGKKGKELQSAGDEGLTDPQKDAFKKIDSETQKVRKQLFDMLTSEQKAGLPEEMKKNLEKMATEKKKKAA